VALVLLRALNRGSPPLPWCLAGHAAVATEGARITSRGARCGLFRG